MKRRPPKTIIFYTILAAVLISTITQYCTTLTNHGDRRKALSRISRILGLSPEVQAKDGTPAGIAWLMTFPNSGTTFTVNLVQKVSQTSAATNYGHERINDNGVRHRVHQSIPLDNTRLNGPFRLSEDHPLNEGGYTLTKTHCGGYCFSDCPPNWYRISAPKFLQDCGLSTRHEENEEGGADRQYWVKYEPQSVSRLVHLMRDPFDNIVSRWHHETHLNAENPKWKFEDSMDGFRAWCENTDRTWKHHERNIWVPLYGQEVYDLAQTVPCHKEFMQYVQWHNNAFELARAMELPHLLLHYEDFYHNQRHAALNLLSFLEVPAVNIDDAPRFRNVTHYLDFYSPYFQRTTAFFIKSVANIDTWLALIRRYPYLSEFVRGYHRLKADADKREQEQKLQQQKQQVNQEKPQQQAQTPQERQQPEQPKEQQLQPIQEQQPQVPQDQQQPEQPKEQQLQPIQEQQPQVPQEQQPQVSQEQQQQPKAQVQPEVTQEQQQQNAEQPIPEQPIQEPPQEQPQQPIPQVEQPPQEVGQDPQPEQSQNGAPETQEQQPIVAPEQSQEVQPEPQPEEQQEKSQGEGDATSAVS